MNDWKVEFVNGSMMDPQHSTVIVQAVDILSAVTKACQLGVKLIWIVSAEVMP